MMRLVVMATAIVAVCHGYPNFQNNIPNGASIPHACLEGEIWNGVGHLNPNGGGPPNPFGIDFAKNDFVWDECLCNHDSDGDGRTNGEELGDPDCMWQMGMTQSRTDRLSHPGVCEPVGSPQCSESNWWLDCDSLVPFSCPAFENPDTETFTIRIEPTPVPAEETTYICAALEFPQTVRERDVHMIGAEAWIDNVDVMHHLIVYGCRDDAAEEVRNLYSTPADCGDMVTEYCEQIVFIWGFGVSPDCYDEEFGVRLGLDGFKTVVMEMHWNNPMLTPNTMDSSGVTFYYTTNLREYDAETVFYGVSYLEIPPGQERVVEEGLCPAECTRQMYNEPIYISAIIPHMHLLGTAMKVWHIRNGEVLRVLVDERQYDYNSPKRHKYSPAVEFLPGDELRTQCVFNSESRDEYTYWGDATNEEMCIAITQYYPSQANGSHCWAYENDTVGECGELGMYGEYHLWECYAIWESDETFADFIENEYMEYLNQLNEKCDPEGLQCFDGCQEVIDYITSQRCFTDNIIGWTKLALLPYIDGLDVLPFGFEVTMMVRQALSSCDDRRHNDTPRDDAHDHDAHDDDMGDECVFDVMTTTYMPDPMPPSASVIVQAMTSLILMTSLVLFALN